MEVVAETKLFGSTSVYSDWSITKGITPNYQIITIEPRQFHVTTTIKSR